MNNNQNINTPYDDVFRTLLNDCPRFFIPVINEAFETCYPMDEKIIQLNDYYFLQQQDGNQEKRITDSCVLIQNQKYHIESQSTVAGDMIIRMWEYDTQIAIQTSEYNADTATLYLEFPKSAILYLRSTKNTPDKSTIVLRVPDDKIISYKVPNIKVSSYNAENIFEKELYFLIPFILFNDEYRFDRAEADALELESLTNGYKEIRQTLDELVGSKITEYELRTFVDMFKKVNENLCKKYNKIKERMAVVMGGNILEYEAKTIKNEGRAEGRAEFEKNVIQKMYKNGMSADAIANMLELTLEHVLNILAGKQSL